MKKTLQNSKKRIISTARKTAQTVHNKSEATLITTKRYIVPKFAFIGRAWQSVRGRARRVGGFIVRISPPWLRRVGSKIKQPFVALKHRYKLFLKRRPHRSFKMTRRRDYKRSLALPGYWAFTNRVRSMLWRNKKLFGGLMIAYFFVALAIGGFGQQDAYQNLSSTLQESGSDIFKGNFGGVAQAGLLLTSSVITGLTPNVTQAQSILGGLAVFFAWLATVWALRNVMADRRVRVRDAIYASGSPVVSTAIVAFVLVLQLIPIAIAISIYNAAIFSELITEGAERMLAVLALVLLGVVSLYWMTSTFIALVVVTLPGMYPFQAIRTSGDLVVGRRLRILLRILWAAILTVVLWLVIIIPIILFDSWIKQVWTNIAWVPIVPTAILLMSSITIVSLAAYIYMLYRRVVDDDAKPA